MPRTEDLYQWLRPDVGTTAERGEGWRRTAAQRAFRCGPERVRALVRATRSARGAGSTHARVSGSSTRRPPCVGRRLPAARLQLNGGGPSPLTQDRQKPRRRLSGLHGTRNTVPSRALTEAVQAAYCRRQRHSWMEEGLRRVRPELPVFAEGTVAVLAHSTPRAWSSSRPLSSRIKPRSAVGISAVLQGHAARAKQLSL